MELNKNETIDNYIKNFPENIHLKLQQIREIIKSNAPTATETINYGMPTFKLNGNLVHFAGYKKHIGFYPTPSPIEEFKEELKNYKTSKGAIQFPINEELPVELITKIVKNRVAMNSKLKGLSYS